MASSGSIYLERFHLEECVEWIVAKEAHNVCLYFLPRFYCLASDIVINLKQHCPDVSFLVMISGSSGVDTLKYRVKEPSNIPDAVIYFGTSCLCASKYSPSLPILFMPLENDANELEYITSSLTQLTIDASNVLLLSDWTNSSILLENTFLCSSINERTSVDVARLMRPHSNNWHFMRKNLNVFDDDSNQEAASCRSYSPYLIPKPLSQYDLVIFLGDCNNLEFIINCQKLVVIDPQNKCHQVFDGPKEFRKRVSLIEKFKRQQSSAFGIVFVNYTESVTSIMNTAKSFAKRLKRSPYFLTLNQTDFEQRLGNFGQLEGFVLVNSCECNFPIVISTAKYLYPIIFWKELQIVCSQHISYGGIEWNADVPQEEEEDEEETEDKEKRMELVERDLFARPDGWFGLVVDAGSKQVGDIKEGLRGIPSSYTTEQELF